MLKEIRNRYRANSEAQKIINALESIYQKWGKLPISFCIGNYDLDLTQKILVDLEYSGASAKRISTGRNVFSLLIRTSPK